MACAVVKLMLDQSHHMSLFVDVLGQSVDEVFVERIYLRLNETIFLHYFVNQSPIVILFHWIKLKIRLFGVRSKDLSEVH